MMVYPGRGIIRSATACTQIVHSISLISMGIILATMTELFFVGLDKTHLAHPM